MLVTALRSVQMHEIPRKERIGQRHVRMNARGCQRVTVQVHAFFEIAPFRNCPIARNGMMTDICEEKQITMPVMQSLAEVHTCFVQGIDQGCFHQARFIDRPARAVIGTRCPLNHPVEYFELAELFLPRCETFGAQVIYERLLAGTCSHCEQRTQILIEQIPFLFKAIEAAGRFFLDSLLEGEQIFIGEFFGWHERFLRRGLMRR